MDRSLEAIVTAAEQEPPGSEAAGISGRDGTAVGGEEVIHGNAPDRLAYYVEREVVEGA